MTDRAEVRSVLAATLLAERPRIVATLIRVTGDWDLAEDCVQDASARALVAWESGGVPGNPAAWLTTVARNRAIDRVRSAASERGALERVAVVERLEELDAMPSEQIADDRLRLVFTCCHPALAMEARVALTLHTVAGLSTSEIARAFLVPEPTMAKRLVRARAKIRAAGIPYRVPPTHLLAERTGGVLAVLYLLFNEGYSASAGPELLRPALADEAIRLTRLVVDLVEETGRPEALGLLALELFQHARRAARVDRDGEIVTLEDQDRYLWDAEAIAAGIEALDRARGEGAAPGAYRLQAMIARCHVESTDAAGTDFARVVRLYDELAVIAPSPVVELNRAVAVAMSRGPAAGLELLDGVERDGRLDGYHLLPATRADLLRRLGRHAEAALSYRRARSIAPTEAERRYLDRRLVEVTKHNEVTEAKE